MDAVVIVYDQEESPNPGTYLTLHIDDATGAVTVDPAVLPLTFPPAP